MSNYTKSTNFATKDTLPAGDSNKIVKGTEIDTEYNNIATAIATKADAASPTFTGTVTISTLSATTGTFSTALAATSGGTGNSSYAVGDLLYASTTTALSKLADVATGNALISGGVGVSPSYGKIGLTTHVSGTLPVANGGTGATSLTANNVILGNGTSAVQVVAPGSSGNVLTSNGTTWASAPAIDALEYSLYTSGSGTWTAPTGVTRVKVAVVGGGSGGCWGNSVSGAVGGVAIGIYTVVPGTGYSYAVGAGGAGGSTVSSAGGTSSFSSFCSATGGAASTSSGSGASGSGTGGTFNNYRATGAIYMFNGDVSRVYSAGSAGANWSATGAYNPGAAGSGDQDAVQSSGGVGGIVLIEYMG